MKARLLILLSLIVLVSCDVQKRRYQKGFYISRAHKKEIKTQPVAEIKKPAPEKIKQEVVQEVRTGDQVIEASATENISQFLKKKTRENDSCDVLIYKDGTESQVKVIEVNPNEIKYKRCDNPNGPVYITRKSDLFMIKFANGSREVIKSEAPAAVPDMPTYNKKAYNKPRVTHPMAFVPLALSILGFIAGYMVLIASASGMIFPPFIIIPLILIALAAVITGKSITDRINSQPDVYKGKGLSQTGMIIGIVLLSIYLVIGFFILLFFGI